MKITTTFLENLKIQASFDDFNIISDQPIRYKGDGSAPGPFDYFLASTAMCASYFVKVYCKARNIPTDNIRIIQNNIVDPVNRYKHIFALQVELPSSMSKKDRNGIISSINRCTVKRVIQESPVFKIDIINSLEDNSNLTYFNQSKQNTKTMISGKDCSLEETISNMTSIISKLKINLEIVSWRNIIPNVWSVHIRDSDSTICFSNGKGATKNAALCSALGEYLERISTNYFYNDYYLGEEISNASFVHYPNEKWFKISINDQIPEGIMDKSLLKIYNIEGELKAHHLIDTNSGNIKRGICTLPFKRQSDKEDIYFPINLIGNLFVSNGMSAGNTIFEARVQALCEIFERAVKKKIIMEEITLPDVPQQFLEKYPHILEGIRKLEEVGFPIVVKDASLGGKFPVMCVTLLNPKNGGVYASFGSHPKIEVALERSLTELLQGRSFEGLNDIMPPTFNSNAVQEQNNIIDHFIDSTGVISWKFLSEKEDYSFCEWNFTGTTKEEFDFLMNILKDLGKEVYIADYNHLGINACRILVPDYSEIYSAEDLVWDNNNLAIQFRSSILNLHNLDNRQLTNLVENLEQQQIDNYTKISELIGLALDENSTWGQLDVGELKLLIYLALNKLSQAQELAQMLTTFNYHCNERQMFFQALQNMIAISLDPMLKLKNYMSSMKKLYGNKIANHAAKSISGEIRFYGLHQTDMNFLGFTKHLQLIESYKKLRVVKE